MYNYLLNTENYEPVVRASRKITELVRENDAIIARLNTLVDLNLRLPQLRDLANSKDDQHLIRSQNKTSENVGDRSSRTLRPDENELGDAQSDTAGDNYKARRESNSEDNKTADESKSGRQATKSKGCGVFPPESVNRTANEFVLSGSETRGVSTDEDPQDYLRNYLDNVLGIAAVPCDKFERVSNVRVRQLLADNFRLQELRNQKQKANMQLLETHTEFQRVLKEVAVPRLNQDVYKHRISQCEMERAAVKKSISQTDQLWTVYAEYLELVEDTRRVAEKLVGLVNRDVNDTTLARLYTQLDILVQLKLQLDSQNLLRALRPICNPFD